MIDKLSNFSYFFFFLQGLNFLIPVLDKIKYVQSLKEIAIDIPEQSAITNGEGTNWVNKLVNIQAWNSMEAMAFVVPGLPLVPFQRFPIIDVNILQWKCPLQI